MNKHSQPWTVEDTGDTTYGIKTGAYTLEMVTDDYQMACDIVDAHESAIAQLREELRQLKETNKELDRQVTLNRENWRMDSEDKDRRFFASQAQLQAARDALEKCRQRAWTMGETWPEVEAALQPATPSEEP